MIALLPIRPIYANAILSGEKRVEFRRTKFKQNIRYVLIYASSPIKKIVGYFEIENIDETTPFQAWRDYSSLGFIDEESYLRYYDGSDKAYVISIQDVRSFDEYLPLSDLGENITPPQSHRYITKEEFDKLCNSAIKGVRPL